MNTKYRDKKWLEEQYITLKKSMNDIAKECTVSSSTIRKWIIKYKIPIRNHSEAGKLKPNSGQFKKRNQNWRNNKYLGLKLICKQCHKEFTNTHMRQKYCTFDCQQKAYKEKHRERLKIKQQEYWLKNEYGLTISQFHQLKTINNKCWICGKDNGDKNLCVDHDHKTNEIRGLLCDLCNMALGLVNDDISILKEMILYLEKKPITFNQSIDEIIEEMGDPRTFMQRFENNPNILSWNIK